MAQNITLLGASYPDVPAVELPKTGGGTASFTDVTDTTAAAEDVAQGKYFYTASGVKTEGTGSGGGGGISADDVAMNNYTELTGTSASFVASYAFYYNKNIVSASFQECKTIHEYAFYGTPALETLSFPACEIIERNAFYSCSSLKEVNLPACQRVSQYAFGDCRSLSKVTLPAVVALSASAFRSCYYLTELHLEGVSSVPTLANSVFASTPMDGYVTSAGRYGSIFVPASLFSAFQTATRWSTMASRMVSV